MMDWFISLFNDENEKQQIIKEIKETNDEIERTYVIKKYLPVIKKLVSKENYVEIKEQIEVIEYLESLK